MDFRTIFLDHFQKCLADEADIDISIMRNMASGNESSANSTLKELMQEGIVASIPEATLADMDAPLEKLKKLNLTEFGINYLNNRNKTQHSAKILADLSAKTTNIPPATINTTMQAAKWQDYVKNVAELSAKVSKISPDTINTAKQAAKWQDYVKNVAELSAKTTNIPPATINTAKQAAKWQDYVKKVAELSANVSNISSATINTAKQAAKWQNMTKEFCSLLDKYKSVFTDCPPEIIGSDEALNELSASIPHANTLAPGMHNLFTLEQIQQITDTYASIGDIVKSQYSGKNKKALASFLNAVDKAQKEIIGSDKVPQIKTAISDEENTKTFTFEGILGQNCGNVVDPSPEDEKRIQVKGFKVNDGLRVLRGFAKASDLYNASEPDIDNYQREVNETHLNGLKKFISEINTAGKYLPELTFVARGGYELFRPEWGWQLRGTQLGNFKNLEFYKIKFDGKKLYRIDGNHRLEALYQLLQQGQEYYIPFSIILYGKQVHFVDPDQEHELDDFDSDGSYAHVDDEEAKRIKDNEAFLFYFLNSKAQRLTTEENYKGLIGSAWEDHEISIANPNIVLLKYLDRVIKENILSYNFCNNEPLKQITEILDKISEPIEKDLFKEIIRRTNDLLAKNRWPQLKKFNFYCQLIFYIAYKHSDINECSAILDRLENWVKKYNFDNTTFDDPILLYNNAVKTNNLNPINVFVAMPYYDEGSIIDFNDQMKILKNELVDRYPVLSNRLKFYEIMRHRGYEIDIQQQIMDQIKSSHIFIADISTHECEKSGKRMNSHANPNVMYELGFAKNQPHTEIILLKNQNDEIDVPSDLITKYHNKYEKDKKYLMRKKIFEAIEGILKEKFDII